MNGLIPLNNGDKNFRKIANSNISQRVINFWNKLPIYVWNSGSVTKVKRNLEVFENNGDEVDSGNLWEVSLMEINKIVSANYVKIKNSKLNTFSDTENTQPRKHNDRS